MLFKARIELAPPPTGLAHAGPPMRTPSRWCASGDVIARVKYVNVDVVAAAPAVSGAASLRDAFTAPWSVTV